jgi:hypothetical protein
VNVTEANAAQILLSYLLNPYEQDCDAAADAMSVLADRSSAALGAGLRAGDVERLWPGENLALEWTDGWEGDPAHALIASAALSDELAAIRDDPDADPCESLWRGWSCTRPCGHPGRHMVIHPGDHEVGAAWPGQDPPTAAEVSQ